MRSFGFACALALAACTSSTGLPNGNADLAGADFAGVDLRGVDFAGPQRICVALCGHCVDGACCPGGVNGCCRAGEWCDNGMCRCGDEAACPPSLMCAGGGIVPNPDSCGLLCCGDPAHPCPL